PRAAAPRRPGLLLGQPPFGGMTIVARGSESVGSRRIPEGLAKTLRPNSRSPGRSYVNAARVDPARPLSMAQGRTRCAKRAGAVIDEVVTMMRFIGALALLLAFAVGAATAGAAPAGAQDFTIVEFPSVTALAPADVKPRMIAFFDHRKDELADPGTGLIRFED